MLKLIIAIFYCIFYQALGIARSLQDCLQTASLFKNTCTNLTTSIDFNSHIGETISCTGRLKCPGENIVRNFTETQPCNW